MNANKTTTTGWITHPACEGHNPGPGHPESPARLRAVHQAVFSTEWSETLVRFQAEVCSLDRIRAAHDPDLVALAEREILAGRQMLSTGDTHVGKGSWEAALVAAGAGLTALRGMKEGRWTRAFCAVRPPGHHATFRRSMGFCVFNAIAIAARAAPDLLGVSRIAILDWDVHHGNGTQDIFYEDPDVLYMSTHQSPWYPGTGAADERGRGRGLGTTVNAPLPAGSGRDEVLGAWRENLRPVLEAFKPEIIMVSAGFDAMAEDPLGSFQLTAQDFADWTDELVECANTHAKGRILSMLEGGYDLPALGRACAAHVHRMMHGPSPAHVPPQATP